MTTRLVIAAVLCWLCFASTIGIASARYGWHREIPLWLSIVLGAFLAGAVLCAIAGLIVALFASRRKS